MLVAVEDDKRLETAKERDGAADERALVARARHEPEAFAALYRRYVDPVFRYCYLRLGNREAAEDATSLVFTKALAAIPSYSYREGPGTFRSWLFTIAHNVITDRYRGQSRETSLDEADAVVDPVRGHAPEEAAIVAEERRSVREVLAQLPPYHRDIVELRMTGHTGPEIAAILGRSVASVKLAQFRAYRRLRSLLGVMHEEEVGHESGPT